MSKRIIALTLAICAMFAIMPSYAQYNVIYTGKVTTYYDGYTNAYVAPDKNSKVLDSFKPGTPIQIVSVLPNFVGIVYGNSIAYMLRGRIEDVKPVNPATTPPYGVFFHRYYAAMWQDTPVKAAPNSNSETLITLHPGAMVGIIDVVDGWAYFTFKRQWGYIDTRYLAELGKVAPNVTLGDANTPIAVYNSFYNISEEGLNPNRISNLKLGSSKMSKTLAPGQSLDFNGEVGPFTAGNGYLEAGALKDGGWGTATGGGSCQISSTLYNAVLQLTGLTVLVRSPHGPGGVSYIPHGVDATSGGLNFVFRNDYSFPIRISAHVQDGSLFVAIYKV
ncbi:MAG TPA: VanW family protein [Christensenellaceae bacterium]|nr:VanW family protein [Christensenellaceae bacterium]